MEMWKRNLIVCWFGVLATSAGLSQLTPILPLYIEQLGVHSLSEIAQWSGFIYGVTFICMAVFSPFWGRAADQYGRKPMLMRASLGMAIIISCMAFVQNVYQLAMLRLLQGTVSGFYAAAVTLVATQTPNERSGWALGTLSTGMVSGMLLGPLLGGYLAMVMGIRSIFIAIGILLVIAFLASVFFVKEEFIPSNKPTLGFREIWKHLPQPQIMIALLVTTMVMQLGLMSIQPIISVYINMLSEDNTNVPLVSGLVFSASGLASIIAAPHLGRLSDRIGPQKVMVVALSASALLFIPQAMVSNPWQLMGLRFLLGIATAGLLPSINSLVKQLTPGEFIGQVFGYNQSAQFIGSFGGALLGGGIAAWIGIQYVFYFTSALLLFNTVWVYKMVYVGKRKDCSPTS